MDFDYNYAVQIMIVILILVLLIVVIVKYSKKQGKRVQETPSDKTQKVKKESFEDMEKDKIVEKVKQPEYPKITQPTKASSNSDSDSSHDDSIKPSEPVGNEDYQAIEFESSKDMPSDCYPKDRLTTEDLLPKDAANTQWAQSNPAGQGSVEDGNLLTAGHHMGINTVGTSLRNANMQLRSDPPIPKIHNLSPWNNTTIEYDSNRRPLEIGGQ